MVINSEHLQTIIYLRESRLKGAKLTGNSPCLSRRLCFPPAGGGGLGRRRSPAHRRRAPVPVPPAASALFIARGQRGGAGRRGAAGDCLGQHPRPRGGGKGGRRGSARHRGPAPCSAPEAATQPCPPWAQPPEAARAPGASSGRRWRSAERGAGTGAGGSRKQAGAGAPVLARPLRPPAPVPASGRPSLPASAAGCHRHRRSLLRRSYTGPRLGGQAGELPVRNAFPGAQPPATLSQSRAPRAAQGFGPASGAAQRPGYPRSLCMTSSTERPVLSFLNCLFSRKRDKSGLTEGGGGINIIPFKGVSLGRRLNKTEEEKKRVLYPT